MSFSIENSTFDMAKLVPSFAGQVGDHVLQVAGLHGFRHVVFCLFDALVSHFDRDDYDAELIGMFFDEGACTVAHKPFRSPFEP